MDLTLFLWLVSTALVFPAARSHSLMVLSWLPVTICIKSGMYMHVTFTLYMYMYTACALHKFIGGFRCLWIYAHLLVLLLYMYLQCSRSLSLSLSLTHTCQLEWATPYLWVSSLSDNISHSIGVSRESVDTSLCSHVPNLEKQGNVEC